MFTHAYDIDSAFIMASFQNVSILWISNKKMAWSLQPSMAACEKNIGVLRFFILSVLSFFLFQILFFETPFQPLTLMRIVHAYLTNDMHENIPSVGFEQLNF